jgi:hypothetical protein
MAKKIKELCKWKKKDISDDFGKFEGVVKNPKFVCKKCGWAANTKKVLHKPGRLK